MHTYSWGIGSVRTKWRKEVNEAFPTRELTLQEKRQLDQWRPGSSLPGNSPVYGSVGIQPGREDGRFQCWVCNDSFLHGNSLQAHYDETHAVCTPALVTTFSCQCPHCLPHFPTLDKRETHSCPATQPLDRLNHIRGMTLGNVESRKPAIFTPMVLATQPAKQAGQPLYMQPAHKDP